MKSNNSKPVCTAKYVVAGKFLKDYPLDPVCHGSCDLKEKKLIDDAKNLLKDRLNGYEAYMVAGPGEIGGGFYAIQSPLYRIPVNGELCEARVFIKPGFYNHEAGSEKIVTSVFAELKNGIESQEPVPLEQVSSMVNLAEELAKSISISYCRQKDTHSIGNFYVKCLGLNVPEGSSTELLFTASKPDDPKFNELREAYRTDKELRGIVAGIKKMYGESDAEKAAFGLYETFHEKGLYLSGQTTGDSRPAMEWAGITNQKDIEKISKHMSHLGPVSELIMLNRLRVGNNYIGLNQSKL